MDHLFSAQYQRIRLSPLQKDETEALRILRNQKRNWFVFGDIISPQQQSIWFEKYLKRPDDCMFSAYHAESGKWVGAVALYHISPNRHSAEFGRLLVDGTRVGEKGLGVDATVCACKIGFEQMGLEEITLEVFADNPAAIKTYRRAGFLQTGEENRDGRPMLLMKIVHEIKQERSGV